MFTQEDIDRNKLIEYWIKNEGVCRGITCHPEKCLYKVATNGAPCTRQDLYDWALKNRDTSNGLCKSIWE